MLNNVCQRFLANICAGTVGSTRLAVSDVSVIRREFWARSPLVPSTPGLLVVKANQVGTLASAPNLLWSCACMLWWLSGLLHGRVVLLFVFFLFFYLLLYHSIHWSSTVISGWNQREADGGSLCTHVQWTYWRNKVCTKSPSVLYTIPMRTRIKEVYSKINVHHCQVLWDVSILVKRVGLQGQQSMKTRTWVDRLVTQGTMESKYPSVGRRART